MKTDRELTELAAKAIGIKPDDFSHDGTAFFGRARWNPLADDGDALRLAVTLGMRIFVYSEEDCECSVFADGTDINWVVRRKDDPYAVTRRAIVRAAAAIGEAMP